MLPRSRDHLDERAQVIRHERADDDRDVSLPAVAHGVLRDVDAIVEDG
jgi:hypothetical protein